MIDDLELLRRYMDEPLELVDLEVAKQRLQASIREETEQSARKSRASGSLFRLRRPGYPVALSGVAAALVVLLVVVALPGGVQLGSSVAAATELHTIANNAAEQAAPK